MSNLSKKNCIDCESNALPFDVNKINKYLKEVKGWIVKSEDEKVFYLEKNYKFKNFTEEQQFVNKVVSISDREGHHPDIYFGWGYTKIKLLTHSIKGLSESDFILAAKIDRI